MGDPTDSSPQKISQALNASTKLARCAPETWGRQDNSKDWLFGCLENNIKTLLSVLLLCDWQTPFSSSSKSAKWPMGGGRYDFNLVVGKTSLPAHKAGQYGHHRSSQCWKFVGIWSDAMLPHRSSLLPWALHVVSSCERHQGWLGGLEESHLVDSKFIWGEGYRVLHMGCDLRGQDFRKRIALSAFEQLTGSGRLWGLMPWWQHVTTAGDVLTKRPQSRRGCQHQTFPDFLSSNQPGVNSSCAPCFYSANSSLILAHNSWQYGATASHRIRPHPRRKMSVA